MKRGAIIVNVSRGGLVDTDAATDALESGQLGGLALDVYEHEGEAIWTASVQHSLKNLFLAVFCAVSNA